jgi:pilus assembly protein CpaE
MSAVLQPQLEPEAGPEDDGGSARYLPPLPRVSIQAFCESQDIHHALSEAAADRRARRAHMTVQAGGLAAALAFYSDSATPNVVVAESSAKPEALLADLDRFAEMCDPGTRVVIIGHTNDVGLYRELMHRGVSEYLVAPVTPLGAIETLSGLFASENAEPLGRTVAFIGAKGGVGSSTVAHNVAWMIAQHLLNDVVVADLDLPFGTAGLDFNQDPPQGMAEAVFARERLDEVYLDRLMSKCSDRLSLIAAPATLDKEYDFPADAFEPVIDLIRKVGPGVVLDLPHVWTQWAKGTLLAADDIVITAMPDLANLRNTKNLVDLLKQSRPHDRSPILVLNQTGIAKKPEISAKDFASALELDVTACIGFEPHSFSRPPPTTAR